MKIKIFKPLFIVSILFNLLFLLFLFTALKHKSSSFSYFNLKLNSDTDTDMNTDTYVNAAAIVSFPKNAAVAFNPIDLSLKPHQYAAVQFSVISESNQINLVNDPLLFDRNIIAVELSGFGFIIHSLAEGSTVLQSFSAGGIKDVLRVTVCE
jgi:hypothetical protein